ncbi:hypothetical protein DV738_g4078, partial [Chaetothyriales sp. CBS 135597]
MGQGQSQHTERQQVPVEQLSHELALHFADKCYTHLEIAHYKDNFKSLADHNDDVEYWKEDTLCRFFAIPQPLRAGAGAVLHSMAVYLGAFPFPSMAPVILTREAMLKVITILTGRYKKILKRGDKDKTKLLFRSLAVFDRSASIDSHLSGFAVDEPANNDDEEEDDDDLALAALDALDAIEVFRHDSKVDRKINHAAIPAENLKNLVILLLLLGGLDAQTPLAAYGDGLDEQKLRALDLSASAIVAAFDPDPVTRGISYSNFVRVTTTTIPDLFKPLSPLFEHLLFSKTLDLNRHKVSLPVLTPSSSLANIFDSSARFHRIFSTASQGTSLSSFSRQVTSWSSATLLLVSGTTSTASSSQTPIILGAYLPTRWRDSTNNAGTTTGGAFNLDPALADAQLSSSNPLPLPRNISFDIDTLETDSEVEKQKQRLKWEEEDAARRRGVNFGGDKEGARALLELAGLVGDAAGSRSGGSV